MEESSLSESKPSYNLKNYLSEAMAITAGFKDYTPFLEFRHNKNLCTVYLGHYDVKNLNIVIIESLRESLNGLKKRDWYFGTFHGSSLDESGSNLEEYTQRVQTFIKRKNRISVKDLDRLILDLI